MFLFFYFLSKLKLERTYYIKTTFSRSTCRYWNLSSRVSKWNRQMLHSAARRVHVAGLVITTRTIFHVCLLGRGHPPLGHFLRSRMKIKIEVDNPQTIPQVWFPSQIARLLSRDIIFQVGHAISTISFAFRYILTLRLLVEIRCEFPARIHHLFVALYGDVFGVGCLGRRYIVRGRLHMSYFEHATSWKFGESRHSSWYSDISVIQVAENISRKC